MIVGGLGLALPRASAVATGNNINAVTLPLHTGALDLRSPQPCAVSILDSPINPLRL